MCLILSMIKSRSGMVADLVLALTVCTDLNLIPRTHSKLTCIRQRSSGSACHGHRLL